MRQKFGDEISGDENSGDEISRDEISVYHRIPDTGPVAWLFRGLF